MLGFSLLALDLKHIVVYVIVLVVIIAIAWYAVGRGGARV